mmetsp:Transcript_16796/g.28071  ORF Transcript_16796/g.28071 Transcript_16796/m.28071 type:complete len:256 (+) Transcript_16796:289-1056(+)
MMLATDWKQAADFQVTQPASQPASHSPAALLSLTASSYLDLGRLGGGRRQRRGLSSNHFIYILWREYQSCVIQFDLVRRHLSLRPSLFSIPECHHHSRGPATHWVRADAALNSGVNLKPQLRAFRPLAVLSSGPGAQSVLVREVLQVVLFSYLLQLRWDAPHAPAARLPHQRHYRVDRSTVRVATHHLADVHHEALAAVHWNDLHGPLLQLLGGRLLDLLLTLLSIQLGGVEHAHVRAGREWLCELCELCESHEK